MIILCIVFAKKIFILKGLYHGPTFLIVNYSIGFSESAFTFLRQISKNGGGTLFIRRKILILVS